MQNRINNQIELVTHVASELIARGPSRRPETGECVYRADMTANSERRCAAGLLIPDADYAAHEIEGVPLYAEPETASEYNPDAYHRSNQAYLWRSIERGIREIIGNDFRLDVGYQRLVCELQRIHDGGPSTQGVGWRSHIIRGAARVMREISQQHSAHFADGYADLRISAVSEEHIEPAHNQHVRGIDRDS